jgi:hypothetical protein
VEIKCQLDATEDFIADLIACSTCFGHHYAHHQELKSIILDTSAYEDGTDRRSRNVGIYKPDAGELP